MFSRVATVFTFLFFVLPLLSSASAIAARGGSPGGGNPGGGNGGGQCNTGSIQCCNSVQAANSPAVTTLAGLLGVVLTGITAEIGLTCNPISVIGVGGNNCNAQPVCCTGNNFNGGLLVVGCSPINVNL